MVNCFVYIQIKMMNIFPKVAKIKTMNPFHCLSTLQNPQKSNTFSLLITSQCRARLTDWWQTIANHRHSPTEFVPSVPMNFQDWRCVLTPAAVIIRASIVGNVMLLAESKTMRLDSDFHAWRAAARYLITMWVTSILYILIFSFVHIVVY